MKCGGWSQFDPKFSDAAVLSAFMDDAAAAAANSRAALTQSPPVDVIKSACSSLAGDRGFTLTFSAFDARHKVRLQRVFLFVCSLRLMARVCQEWLQAFRAQFASAGANCNSSELTDAEVRGSATRTAE